MRIEKLITNIKDRSIRSKIYLLTSFFLVILSVYGFSIYRSKQTNKIPESYENCLEVASREYRKSDEIKYECIFRASVKKDELFQKCLNLGGIKVPEACMLCPGCGCADEHCCLVYYNPNFLFPKNYSGCEENSGTGGSGGGNRYCELKIQLNGAHDKAVAGRLFEECKNLGGDVHHHDGIESCALKYWRNTNR